jgi:hypothetical protein
MGREPIYGKISLSNICNALSHVDFERAGRLLLASVLAWSVSHSRATASNVSEIAAFSSFRF